MITPPHAPGLPAQLDTWDEGVDSNLEIDRALVRGADFSSVAKLYIDSSKLDNVALTGADLEKLECADTVITKLEAAALRAYKANLLRVVLNDSRLTGAEFAETHFEDCVFKNVKFDDVGFRFATFKRVRFENCILRAADFSNAQLAHVTFSGCDLEAANFISAECKGVDISSEDLTTIKGVLGLKGASISTEQLIQLAPLLATELGFKVIS
ncbi:MAG TPA: pentapeptide repeat-containing protein [Candidatus Saccharimonadales bacterium]|nr:pentapeptide repeat-containing protein [Candidatus Saccharimonadales bacterium]